VAVRAEHLAFRDFELDRPRAPTLPDHRADVRHLVTLVIEVEPRIDCTSSLTTKNTFAVAVE
jgi:hypothetical protein